MSQQPNIYWLLRRFLWLIFFWILAVIVLLTVAGIRYNWQSRRLVQTASVALTPFSNKTKVNLTLNGATSSHELPLIINQLEPGSYTVLISQTGKRPWQKTFNLSPSQALTFEDIILFDEIIKEREATPQEVSALSKVTRLVSAGLLIRENELFDIKDEETLIVRMSQPIEQAIWFPRRSHVVVRVGKAIIVLESDGTNLETVANLKEDENVKMAIVNNGRNLLIQTSQNAYSYQLFTP